uniref:ParA n=1 Tax=Bartonella rattaustraliani TaxID=481139 RepID=D3TZD4_9HYPH|nr:ParA [Bartonella rattaustraliani]
MPVIIMRLTKGGFGKSTL